MTENILTVLLFLIPGFIALSVSDMFSSKTNLRHGDQQKLWGTVVMGAAVFLAYSVTIFSGNLQAAYASFTSWPSIWQVTWALALALVLGLAWGIWKLFFPMVYRSRPVRWLYKKAGQPGYNGYRTVLEDTIAAIHSERYVQLRLLDGRIYYGLVKSAGSLDADKGLLLEAWSYGQEEEKDKLRYELFDYAPDARPLIYVPGEQIKSLELIPASDPPSAVGEEKVPANPPPVPTSPPTPEQKVSGDKPAGEKPAPAPVPVGAPPPLPA